MDYHNLSLQYLDLMWATVVRVEVPKPVGGFKEGAHTYLPPATYIVSIPHNYKHTEITPITLVNDPNLTILGTEQ